MSLKFKRHYPLLIILVLVTTLFTLGLGDQRIIAYTVQGDHQIQQQEILGSSSSIGGSGTTFTNDIALFDDTLVHSIQIVIADEEYQQMITTYQQTGVKDYFHADVIIDGVRVNNVGIRLKGNASLRTALGTRGGLGMFGGDQMPFGRGNRQPFDLENMPDPGVRPGLPDEQGFNPENMPVQLREWQMPELPQDAQQFGNIPSIQVGDSAKIPLLIKFNEFISGQSYQGYTRLAIRTYGISSDAAMLQEPVTNDVFRTVGLPAAQTAYAGVRLNDETERLFVISEVIDGTYLARYFSDSDGVLYKAELGANLRYQGEDPSAYANSFTQQTRVNDADLAPLIAFMRFLTESDDATLERELPGHLDVDAFATYLAINNLLVNTDSIAGMSNNYYLYYDDQSQHFTLLMWDANESLGKLAGGNQAASYDLYYQNQQGIGRGMGLGGSNLPL